MKYICTDNNGYEVDTNNIQSIKKLKSRFSEQPSIAFNWIKKSKRNTYEARAEDFIIVISYDNEQDRDSDYFNLSKLIEKKSVEELQRPKPPVGQKIIEGLKPKKYNKSTKK